MKIPANGFTHAGKFHADDVFATALLQILRPDMSALPLWSLSRNC